MYTLDFYTLVKAVKDISFICSLVRIRAGELNEPVGFLVSSPYVLS